jgi:hypothetical protein
MRQLRVALAETQRQFESPEKGKCPPLEAVTRRPTKNVAEDTSVHM